MVNYLLFIPGSHNEEYVNVVHINDVHVVHVHVDDIHVDVVHVDDIHVDVVHALTNLAIAPASD